MLFSNIIERRNVKDGVHYTVLEIPSEEYMSTYNEYNDEIASDIINYHFKIRADDGRPQDVRMKPDINNNVVKIYARVDYLGNDHTDY